jgi:hypothetical protein
MTASVKGFGCRASASDRPSVGGRRRKPPKNEPAGLSYLITLEAFKAWRRGLPTLHAPQPTFYRRDPKGRRGLVAMTAVSPDMPVTLLRADEVID